MLNVTKLPKPRRHRVEFKVTWTGVFPVALMAAVGARPLQEWSTHYIEQSLRPYIDQGESSAVLCMYVEDAEMIAAGRDIPTEDFHLVRDVPCLVHPKMRTIDWYKAGCTISDVRVDSSLAWKPKYAHVARVKVCGDFPFDMLRYDDSFLLAADENIANLLTTFNVSDRDPDGRPVLIVKYTEGKKSPWPSMADGRWHSFRAYPERVTYDDVSEVEARV
jgi:hypothetical protein